MKRDDAEQMYDGAIPKGAITPGPYRPDTAADELSIGRQIQDAQAAMQARAFANSLNDARAILAGHAEGKTMVLSRQESGREEPRSVNPASVYRAQALVRMTQNDRGGQER